MTYTYFTSISFEGGYRKGHKFVEGSNFWIVLFKSIYHSIVLHFTKG